MFTPSCLKVYPRHAGEKRKSLFIFFIKLCATAFHHFYSSEDYTDSLPGKPTAVSELKACIVICNRFCSITGTMSEFIYWCPHFFLFEETKEEDESLCVIAVSRRLNLYSCNTLKM